MPLARWNVVLDLFFAWSVCGSFNINLLGIILDFLSYLSWNPVIEPALKYAIDYAQAIPGCHGVFTRFGEWLV
jgi:hypothetical protein